MPDPGGRGGAWSGGCMVPGGCLVLRGGGAWSRGVVHGPRGVHGGDPPGRLLLRAVRILLECILVQSS